MTGTRAGTSGDQQLRAALRRHVGHTLRCSREELTDAEWVFMETVALRCEDCGEVLVEFLKRRVRTHART